MVKESYLWDGMYLDSIPEEVIRSITQTFDYREGAGFDETIKVPVKKVIFSDQSTAFVSDETGLLYEVPGWIR